MDGLNAIFYCLILIFLATIAFLQVNRLYVKEGFADSATASSASGSSSVEATIRAALDPYLNSDMCSLYTQLRTIIGQGIQGNENPPTPETLTKVDAYLKQELTVAPLPCPAFTYPTAKAEIEWLVFLNELPVDIGGRYVLMAIYAQRELKFRAKNIKLALSRSVPIPDSQKNDAEAKRMSKKVLLSALPTEGFTSIVGICPVSVQDTRRMEAKHASCKMPEDLTHEEIVESVDNILKKMAAEKDLLLGKKFIATDIDVSPFIKDALESSEYLKTMKAKALDGSLIYEMTPM
jgi:hypothetical protein